MDASTIITSSSSFTSWEQQYRFLLSMISVKVHPLPFSTTVPLLLLTALFLPIPQSLT